MLKPQNDLASPQPAARTSRRIEDCRGDFGEVARLIEESWSENNQQALLYPSEYLASCFDYPGASLAMAPAIYDGPTALGFVAGFPRRIRLSGRELNIVIVTFLTAARAVKKRGYGILLWSELAKRVRAAGFDGMVNYCVKGEAMHSMILGCCRLQQVATLHAHTIRYWSRMLLPREIDGEAAEPDARSVDRFLALATPVAEQACLARLWSPEEAEWQCLRRFGSVVMELDTGTRRGMVTGYVLPLGNAERTKCLILEDVLWGTLETQEREALLKKCLNHAIVAGARMAIVPDLGYADLAPFHAARFRRSAKMLDAYLSVWNGEPAASPLSSLYLDVF